MSEVFDGYERQYNELSASLSRKCTSAIVLEGDEKEAKLTEIKDGLEDGDALIRKMDLEARSLQPTSKGMLLAKLREYKSDLNNLKSDVKRISTARSARDELMEIGMTETSSATVDQRGRLLMSTDRINQSSERIMESRRTILETEEIGVSILEDLHQQRQSLLNAHSTLHGVDDNISKSKKILVTMTKRLSRNKWTLGSIISALALAILLVLYFKLIH
ncbi:Vesicle transport v-SNARE 13 [Zostera marina]|uniref:Vesicle transport v-SNARE 13 n=1 Tax=Zostera marina TaxID=29655 RepID=A0A0K9P305_ZOSMR|nr:Vesicle transport v-SNARE 13 [Zostera marina]